MLKFGSFVTRYYHSKILSSIRCLHSAIPPTPVVTVDKNTVKSTVIDEATVDHLERLSLVDFANARGIQRLEEAIKLADQLAAVDTVNVKPMYSVLEESSLYLRGDEVKDGGCRKEVMANAAVTEEEYFVAPPGNIPLAPRESSYKDN